MSIHVRTRINGQASEILCQPGESVLELLRDRLQLFGTKEGCNSGDCGACSVLLDGRLVCACLVLAAELEDRELTTIEGIAGADGLDVVQRKLLEHNALQCGICIPGIVISAVDLLRRRVRPTETEVRYHLAGNLCRCTGYDKIVRAVMDAADEVSASRGES